MLECKTTDGFFFAMFDFIMPKYINKNNVKRFRYFQSVTFRVTLNMAWHRALWRIVHNFLFSPLSKQIKTKNKVKRIENLIDF